MQYHIKKRLEDVILNNTNKKLKLLGCCYLFKINRQNNIKICKRLDI